jgi:hypothetical protein
VTRDERIECSVAALRSCGMQRREQGREDDETGEAHRANVSALHAAG